MRASEWTLNKGSPGILYPHSLRKGKPVIPLLLLCLSVHPPGQATGLWTVLWKGLAAPSLLPRALTPESSTCSSHCSCIQSYLHWAYSSKLTTLLHPTHFILGIIKLGLISIYLFFSKSLGPCASLSSMNIFSKQDIWVYLCCSGLLQLFNWLDHMLLWSFKRQKVFTAKYAGMFCSSRLRRELYLFCLFSQWYISFQTPWRLQNPSPPHIHTFWSSWLWRVKVNNFHFMKN